MRLLLSERAALSQQAVFSGSGALVAGVAEQHALQRQARLDDAHPPDNRDANCSGTLG